MQICLVTPAPPASRAGNRNTALRWARLLRALGHRVRIASEWQPHGACTMEARAPTELLLALHARRSHASIARFHSMRPGAPLIVALTGTDIYRDLAIDADARSSLVMADRLIVLQPCALDELAAPLRARTQVVYQSAPAAPRVAARVRCFELCVVGHLREEKDPLCAARALALLPGARADTGQVLRITHVGRSLDPALEAAAHAAMAVDRRYRWLGEVTPGQARRLIARSRAMIISSRLEGGANVVSEAIAAGTPVLASRIPGNIGLLGEDWPACYPVGDAPALASLIQRFSADAAFRQQTSAAMARRAWIAAPAQERAALDAVVTAATTDTAARAAAADAARAAPPIR